MKETLNKGGNDHEISKTHRHQSGNDSLRERLAAGRSGISGRTAKVAESIRQTAAERPVILLAGPSGSGKTTTAFLLERFLDRWGVETHTISMDNFFSTMTPQQRELSAKGKLDLESPARVDIPYLNQQLQKSLPANPHGCRGMNSPQPRGSIRTGS